MSAKGIAWIAVGAFVLGVIATCVVGYALFGRGYSDALVDNQNLRQSLAERDGIIERLQASGSAISSGITGVIGQIQANDDRLRQLEDIERTRQENARRAIAILENGTHVE